METSAGCLTFILPPSSFPLHPLGPAGGCLARGLLIFVPVLAPADGAASKVAGQRAAPVLWNHMGQRVSHLLRVDPVTLEVPAAFPQGAASEIKARSIVADPWSREWLRTLRRGASAVSGYRSDGAGGYTLVAVGVDDD